MRTALTLTLALATFNSYSAELINDKTYRARTNLEVTDSAKQKLKVGSQSKFVVLVNDDKDKYAIKFTNIYQYGEILPPKARTKDKNIEYKNSDVIKGEIYFLSKQKTLGVPVETKVEQSFSGLVSGPLVVPFKYRLNDKSIGGDATIGYYAGWGIDTNFFSLSEKYVTFTPFLSAGLTQISVVTQLPDGSSQTDSNSGISWAGGVLISNWDSVNIGIVYGQDRIGDQDWTHEGEGWLSISVGWQI